ncbi:ECF transporter S component [Tumebacillus sp. DT12]|uniref:ECF transporter S component n=1 Tax=Tumebacillus lacus TaxID=2995335 RepID=A0ABT3WZI7_9BACL|nr:ECF transporter S component [Tumebacillus lacus]MCX7570073.1 ECF transporter S component [Tumebacillus lacus]
MKTGNVVNFREVMITVILAIICGFLYVGWAPLFMGLDAALPGAGDSIYGVWFFAGVLAALIVQKPGIALLAEVAAASGELLMGGPYGLSTLLYGLAQGAATEVIFLIFGYKNFKLPVLLLAGAAAGAASLVYDAFSGYLAELNTTAMTAKIVLRVLSGAIFAGLLAQVVAGLLVKTGVLNSYAIVKKKMERPF